MTLPPTRKGRESRERVLIAARVTFARLGYVETRVQDIAIEAEIAMGGLYRYFSSKDDVFAEILRDIQREIMLRTSANGRQQPGVDLRAGNLSFFQYCAENPGIMRAYHQAESVSPQFRVAATRVRRAISRRLLTTLIREEPSLETVDPDRLLLHITSLLVSTEAMALSAYALEEEPLAHCSVEELTTIADGIWTKCLGQFVPSLLNTSE